MAMNTTPRPADTRRVPVMRGSLGPSPDGSAFAIFRANSASLCEIGLLDGADAADFWFRSTLYQLPRAIAFRAASAGHTSRRGPEQIALGHDEIAIFVLTAGRTDGVCDGRRVREEAGDIAIRDYARPFAGVQSAYEAMILTVPRDRFPPTLLTLDLHGAHIPAADGAARLVSATLASLLDTAEDLSIAEFEAAVDGICVMLAGVLRGRIARASADDLRLRALALIDQHLHEPDFGPAGLEACFGLSRSGLYRLFEPLGGVSAAILRRRLDRSVQALLAGKAGQTDFAHIAEAHGFSGSEHLTRAFRKRFSLTPRAFQEMAGGHDPATLIAQAERAGFASLPDWLANAAQQGTDLSG